MTSQQKAEKYATEARANGWKTTVEPGDGPDHWRVSCERGDETIRIFWVNNTLTETPKYTLLGTTTSLHNAATATRQLALKPNLEKAYSKKSRRAAPTSGEDGAPLPIIRHPLPFDIWEDSDATILRRVRGAKIVYFNTMLNCAEAVTINKLQNMNLDHFNLTESKDGKPILNFISAGQFRSIYLEAILQVS